MKTWVNVEDQLPEVGQTIFYYFDIFDKVYPGEYLGNGGFGGKYGFLCGGEVQYWIPRDSGDEPCPSKPDQPKE